MMRSLIGIILPAMLALMAWVDYESDGDRLNLVFAAVLTAITILSILSILSILREYRTKYRRVRGATVNTPVAF